MEEIQHILRFRHDTRPLCNQPVAALTERIDAPSRQRKYLFSLLQRQIRRNQGAASLSRFHDQHQVGKSADDPVPCREIICPAFGTWFIFADNPSVFFWDSPVNTSAG